MIATKESLLASRMPTDEVEIPGVGTVRVRALSRSEALSIRSGELPVLEFERTLLALAVVEPALSKDDVQAWQDACPATGLEPVIGSILTLSGMRKESPKEAMQSFRE
ncbi:hypothetical protein ACL02T_20365 [Pseudonocardia sp. RS010]|uniref:hypothetical protein n=1 Tax=Pseudonocardia sp. RS010 TaxID=3385979 RepID=UPI0039A2C7F6